MNKPTCEDCGTPLENAGPGIGLECPDPECPGLRKILKQLKMNEKKKKESPMKKELVSTIIFMAMFFSVFNMAWDIIWGCNAFFNEDYRGLYAYMAKFVLFSGVVRLYFFMKDKR